MALVDLEQRTEDAYRARREALHAGDTCPLRRTGDRRGLRTLVSGEDDVAFRLLHTADWHLGKRFPSFDEAARQTSDAPGSTSSAKSSRLQHAAPSMPSSARGTCLTSRAPRRTGGAACGTSCGDLPPDSLPFFCCQGPRPPAGRLRLGAGSPLPGRPSDVRTDRRPRELPRGDQAGTGGLRRPPCLSKAGAAIP